MIEDHGTFAGLLNLVVASRRPVPWMADDARRNPNEIDINTTLGDVFLRFDR